MTSGSTDWVVRKAVLADLDRIKIIADRHKRELGFVVRRALERSIEGNEVLVADRDIDGVAAFTQYHYRRDNHITLYNIAVLDEYRSLGLGSKMIDALVMESHLVHGNMQAIVLKCPSGLPANAFYEKLGFALVSIQPGKHRALNIWKLALESNPS